MALFTEGLREFEVTGERQKTFALTLLRGVGVLGKEDLLLRLADRPESKCRYLIRRCGAS